MKILLTGGCGFIGTNLTNALLNNGHSVTVVDTMWFGNFLKEHDNLKVIKADVRDTEKIPMSKIETVIHLANIANDPTGDLDSKLTWEVNALASKFLVEKAIDNGVKQFIYASSGSVYGIKKELDVTEDLKLLPITDYNKSKMISERILLSYKEKIKLQIVRPATVCGYSSRMRLDLSVNMLTFQALENERITVFGGKQTRPNIHINDMVRVYLHFLNPNHNLNGIYNAGFENISILDIAKQIVDIVPAQIDVSDSNDPRSYRQNSDKLMSTGFVPKYGIKDGIKDVIKAYKNGLIKPTDDNYNIKAMKRVIMDKGLN